MVYKYRRISIFIQILVCAVWDFALICFAYFLDTNGKFFTKILFGIPAITFVIWASFIKEILDRQIEFTPNYVRFNSFRLKNVMMKSTISFNVNYENILSIEAKKMPLVGIYGINISAKNLPQKIIINFNFRNHKNLYKEMCTFANQYNPNVYIDNRLQDYIERNLNE